MKDTSATRNSRRRFLQQASLVVAGSVVAPRLVFAQGSDPVADTTNGKVRGVAVDGVKLFRGIPTAATPRERTASCPRRRWLPGPACATARAGATSRRSASTTLPTTTPGWSAGTTIAAA